MHIADASFRSADGRSSEKDRDFQRSECNESVSRESPSTVPLAPPLGRPMRRRDSREIRSGPCPPLSILMCVGCGAAALLLVAGCASGRPTAPSDLTTEELFRLYCSTCHGDGTGNGHIAGTLKVKPRDLRDGTWQQSVDDERIRRVIRDGGPAVQLSPEMPGFRDKLSGRQIADLVAFVRALAEP